MDHYLEITLLPDTEFPAPMLMSALFAKLHRVLVQISSTDIGISFPTIAANHLGNTLRLHGSAAALKNLMERSWLVGMRDHSDVKEIHPVPAGASQCRVKRVQTKSSVERLRRRYQKRFSDALPEDIAKRIPDSMEQRLSLPYVRLKSLSTGNDFLMFLQQLKVEQSQKGVFNAYGLSSNGTVPWF